MAHVKIDDDIRGVLEKCSAEGSVIKLPGMQLDRKLYEKVDKAFKAAGGKWNKSKGGHVFDKNAADVLGNLLEVEMVRDTKKDRGAFYSPEAVARAVLARTRVQVGVDSGARILEPSAGSGCLADVLRGDGYAVTCVEIDAIETAKLETKGYNVWSMDFLEISPDDMGQYDAVVMNPPFKNRLWLKHVAHACQFVKNGGSMICIVPRIDRGTFDKLLSTRVKEEIGPVVVVDLPEDSFKESGTKIATSLVSFQVSR